MTLLEKHEALLRDLEHEYDEAPAGSYWSQRLYQKIKDLNQAIERLRCES